MKRLVPPRAAAASASADPAFADAEFARAVIAWQKRHGRHALPWQNTRDAYRIWLSEIMLQQTQVTAVIPYYQRFLDRFPDVATLAAAPSEDVMAHWAGLGYYSRARNLHRCAQEVVEKHGGRFPQDPAALAALPGIGRSTAAAIAAFAFGARAAILDGNVKRVFARVFGIEGYPGEKKIEDQLWQRAEALLPESGIEAYTQGLMDMGATLCTRSRPQCAACPLAAACVAHRTGRQQDLPVRKPKKALPEKSLHMLVISDGARVLLEQRPDSGIWGGLLSLPELPLIEEEDALRSALAAAAGRHGELDRATPLAPFSHGFTHYKLHVHPWLLTLAAADAAVQEDGLVWLAHARLEDAPLPAPVKKLLLALFDAPGLL